MAATSLLGVSMAGIHGRDRFDLGPFLEKRVFLCTGVDTRVVGYTERPCSNPLTVVQQLTLSIHTQPSIYKSLEKWTEPECKAPELAVRMDH